MLESGLAAKRTRRETEKKQTLSNCDSEQKAIGRMTAVFRTPMIIKTMLPAL
jgi:hypothetical protein